MRTANEELEEQSQRLRQSEERLTAQQEELEVSNEELEEKNKVLQRQKQEVEQARKAIAIKAEELAIASKYKSEFLANMSHELRTPLNSLLLLAQSLAQNKIGNFTSEQIEAARIIHSSGSDLLNLINEILDLSKIEAGRMSLQLGMVDINELAESLRSSFAHMATQKALGFEIQVATEVPSKIYSDMKRVNQIMRNLIANALKFTEQGHIVINISRGDPLADLSRSHLVAGECLAIAVTDTGIGIAEDKRTLIFEAFQQADGSTSRRYGGTGLGLTISRELANLLGGEIQLRSQLGQGSTFTLFLPLDSRAPDSRESIAANSVEKSVEKEPVEAVAITSPLASSNQLTEAISNGHDRLALNEKFILIIEDDSRFAAILANKCQEKGIKCVVAPTGDTGLDLIDKRLPSAIILDIRLPDMDGLALLSVLKDDTRTRHIPVHIISVDDQATESLRRGAIGHAIKPIGQERLEEVFKTLTTVSPGQLRRVLVVEDDDAVRAKTVELLREDEIQVSEATTGYQAIQMLHADRYDCVVLDLKLPDMDGQTLLEQLKQEGIALPPVIVHTARDLGTQEEMNLREHAESIVIKDVRSPERLIDEVSLFLHRVVSQMPERKRRVIHDLHDADALFRDKKVLIVDDDMRTMFALSRLVAERGFQPIKAENGDGALTILAEQPDIDIVLMDIMMPQMDGYEAMRRIRAQEHLRKLPIIALTAKAMPEDRQKCIAAGASDYLPKPVDGDRLFSMMRVWLYH